MITEPDFTSRVRIKMFIYIFMEISLKPALKSFDDLVMNNSHISYYRYAENPIIRDKLKKSHYAIMPSVGIENYPTYVLESFAAGTVVIGANMFMARIYGVQITPALLFTVLISIVLLSLRAPSMAGADLAIIIVLLSQIGIPAGAIALIMGIDTLLDMMQAMCNTTSDAAVALIVAKRSGELNTKMYV